MTDDEASFVEELGQYLGSTGMTPMAGRMWAWLLICDPAEQTATQLSVSLRASRGAISGTARLLESAGFVRRTRRRGDRNEYFSAPASAFRNLIMHSGTIYRRIREITEHGLGTLTDLPPPRRERLEEVHDFLVFVERELPALIDRYISEREPASRSVATT